MQNAQRILNAHLFEGLVCVDARGVWERLEEVNGSERIYCRVEGARGGETRRTQPLLYLLASTSLIAILCVYILLTGDTSLTVFLQRLFFDYRLAMTPHRTEQGFVTIT